MSKAPDFDGCAELIGRIIDKPPRGIPQVPPYLPGDVISDVGTDQGVPMLVWVCGFDSQDQDWMILWTNYDEDATDYSSEVVRYTWEHAVYDNDDRRWERKKSIYSEPVTPVATAAEADAMLARLYAEQQKLGLA